MPKLMNTYKYMGHRPYDFTNSNGEKIKTMLLSIRAQVVVRTTVWAFIYIIEHTKTKGGSTEKYAH